VKTELLAAALLSFLFAGCTGVFFQPSGRVFSDPSSKGYTCEAVKFSSSDGTELTGLFFPSFTGEARGTVVHFHGNAQNMTAHYPLSAWMAARGYNVLVFDYRGYGASGGKVSLEGAVKDSIAAAEEAVRLPGADRDRIIFFGQSLGGAMAVAAAAEGSVKPAAMILDSCFCSYRGEARYFLKRSFLGLLLYWLPSVGVSDAHVPCGEIGTLLMPKLFLASQNDDTVPYSQSLALYRAAPEPKEFIDIPYGHISAVQGFEGIYRYAVLDFLDKNLPAERAGR